MTLQRVKVHLHTAINRADFKFRCMLRWETVSGVMCSISSVLQSNGLLKDFGGMKKEKQVRWRGFDAICVSFQWQCTQKLHYCIKSLTLALIIMLVMSSITLLFKQQRYNLLQCLYYRFKFKKWADLLKMLKSVVFFIILAHLLIFTSSKNGIHSS